MIGGFRKGNFELLVLTRNWEISWYEMSNICVAVEEDKRGVEGLQFVER